MKDSQKSFSAEEHVTCDRAQEILAELRAKRAESKAHVKSDYSRFLDLTESYARALERERLEKLTAIGLTDNEVRYLKSDDPRAASYEEHKLWYEAESIAIKEHLSKLWQVVKSRLEEEADIGKPLVVQTPNSTTKLHQPTGKKRTHGAVSAAVEQAITKLKSENKKVSIRIVQKNTNIPIGSIQKTPAWKRHMEQVTSEKRHAKPKERQLRSSTLQCRPDEQSPVADIWDRTLAKATPKERAKMEAMTEEDRAKLIALTLEQEADECSKVGA